MATHCILYLGDFDRNFSRLAPETADYERADGSRAVGNVPGPNIDGIKFGYMQLAGKGEEAFLLVRVGKLVLRAPVLLQRHRHLDGKGVAPGESPTTFGDESALHVLVDAIVANAEYRDVLGKRISELGPR